VVHTSSTKVYRQSRRSGGVYVCAGLARLLDVPQPCRSVQSEREFAVRTIEPSGVMLLG
jgi:hypothetical protein